MDILKHPIYKAIYELGQEIESLPASEHATKLSVMCSNLQHPADQLYQELQASMKTKMGRTQEDRDDDRFDAEMS